MKLETLEDLETETDYPNHKTIVEVQDLRILAIKWIKRLKKEDDYEKHMYSDTISLTNFKKLSYFGEGVGISWEECSDIPAIIVFIKHFFNLTEEDLI